MILNNRYIPILDPKILESGKQFLLIQGGSDEQPNQRPVQEIMGALACFPVSGNYL